MLFRFSVVLAMAVFLSAGIHSLATPSQFLCVDSGSLDYCMSNRSNCDSSVVQMMCNKTCGVC